MRVGILCSLRLVFTSDGVGVGVVIRSVKRYDLVKIKQRSRKQSFLLRLRFRRLRSSENQFVGVVSRSGRTKPIINRGNEHRDWFILPLLLPTPTIWFSLDRKRRNRKRSWKKMETFWFFRLQFRRAYDSAYDSDVWFSLGHKRSYDSAYDSDSDSVAGENQPLQATVLAVLFKGKATKGPCVRQSSYNYFPMSKWQ